MAEGWTKVENCVIDDSSLTYKGRLVYVVLGRHMNGDRKCYPSLRRIAQVAGISKHSVMRGIEELVKYGYISAEKRYVPGTKEHDRTIYRTCNRAGGGANKNHVVQMSTGGGANETPQVVQMSTRTRTIKQDLENNTSYTPEFENWWAAYPRKVEKRAAFGKYKATVKKGADPKELLLAAKNYKAICESEDRESRYIKHPATFLGPAEPWREYLVCEATKTPEQVAAEMFGRGG